MLARICKKKAKGESGFTLIELLVVIIIIAILAAIAIPMYLSQRKKGWHATAQSDARNAAVAMESYYVGAGNGTYTDATQTLLEAEGFLPSANAAALVIAIDTDGQGYAITTQDTRDTACTYTYDSDTGAPVGTGC